MGNGHLAIKSPGGRMSYTRHKAQA